MTLLLSLAWGGLVGVAVLSRRPASSPRIAALVRGGSSASSAHPRQRLAITPPSFSRRALVLGVPLLLAGAALFPPLALVGLAGCAIRPTIVRRRAAARFAASVDRDVADVVTLIGLAVSAGHNLLGALGAAAAHADGPLGAALARVIASVGHGVRLADALEQLPDTLGEVVRPVVVALVSCDRYGAPLGPTLDRLSADVRTAARQRSEAAARRLPIRLLFPLVTCILPAFGLLTVAPLIAGSLRELRL